MREWAPDGEFLTVRLHSAIKKTYRLTLSFERILDETPETLTIPFPRAEDVLRESGWAVLSNDDGLIVRVGSTQGLSQLDPEEVPVECGMVDLAQADPVGDNRLTIRI